MPFKMQSGFCKGCSWPLPAGKKAKQQTDPPCIPLSQLYPAATFPEGEWQSYKEE